MTRPISMGLSGMTIRQGEQEAEEYQQKIIHPLEKKLFDIQEMVVVNEQTVLAMEVVIRNNQELIRHADRVRSVTLSTVNTAMLLAANLNHQKVSLQKLDALYRKERQTIERMGRAVTRKVSVEGLQESFQEAFDVYDELEQETQNFLPENEIKISEIQKKSETNEPAR